MLSPLHGYRENWRMKEDLWVNTCRIYFIDEILPWRLSEENILKGGNRWPDISVAFTPFTSAACACFCSIKWRLQIYLLISLFQLSQCQRHYGSFWLILTETPAQAFVWH